MLLLLFLDAVCAVYGPLFAAVFHEGLSLSDDLLLLDLPLRSHLCRPLHQLLRPDIPEATTAATTTETFERRTDTCRKEEVVMSFPVQELSKSFKHLYFSHQFYMRNFDQNLYRFFCNLFAK